MLFQILTNNDQPNDLAADNSDANNKISSRRGGVGCGGDNVVGASETSAASSAAMTTKSIITKIPSMSEINYINYINSTRLGMPGGRARSFKSTVFAGMPGDAGAFLISSTKDDASSLDPNSITLYDILDKYYQMCMFFLLTLIFAHISKCFLQFENQIP